MRYLCKFFILTDSDRHLLVSAALLLGTVKLGLWLLPFQTLQSLLARKLQANNRFQKTDRVSLNKVVWAVTLSSRYMSIANCLTRALATQVLLSQHGQPAHLCIGIAKDNEGKLIGHAWVNSQGTIVVGNLTNLSDYTTLPPKLVERLIK